VRTFITALIGLAIASPAFAGPCTNSINALQRRVDAAIEQRAGSDGWKPESLSALRSHQPTPQSLAATEAGAGIAFEDVLNSLDSARAADRNDSIAACRRMVTRAREELLSSKRMH
jgi:uncharacterized caspase-like protein